eukprot:14952_1
MDDFVEFRVFHAQLLDVSVDTQKRRSELASFGQLLMDNINTLCNNYLWRKDCFHMEPHFINATSARIKNKGSSHLSHFKGTMYYGGDIHDEWFVVHLLYELSAIHKDLLIQVYDNDGQFLLIHTAYNLPQWISPTNAQNRVFIHQNKLHLIPVSHATNQITKSIEFVLNNSIDTLANNDIQNSIHHKLKQFTIQIHQNPGINYHSSVVVLPQKCAHILHKHPFIISYIVDAFASSYAMNTRIKHKAQRKFELKPSDYVFVSVRFTRYLYGMLASKPLKSAPMYYRKHKFDFKQYENVSKLKQRMVRDAFLNGIKLMMGFELFYEKCKTEIRQENTDREWLKFRDSLIKKGCFSDCIVSSDAYQKRIQSAKEYYHQNMKKTDAKESSLCVENGVHPNDIFAFCLNVMEEEKASGDCDWIKVYDESDAVSLDGLRHDDESWMNITDTDLNELLSEYSNMNDPKQQQMLFEEMLNDEEQMNEVTQQTNDDILSLKESLNTFLDQKSSLDGVEMDTEKEETKDNDGIQLDAERVIDIVTAEHEKKYDEERDAMETMMKAMDDELVNKQKVCP